MKIVIIDGQGGKMGKSVIEQLKKRFPELETYAIGTNSIASRLGISAVPSVAFIQNGKLAGVLTGQITRQALEDGLIHM